MTIHDCDRAFARIDCGLLHYRHVTPHEERSERAANLLPSVLMHASPSSSRSLQSLALALANSARGEVIAPDTPGNGDSAPLRQATPELADYASAMVQLLDELKIERANLYGFHTGAHIAIEMAIAHPERVGRVVLDGLLWLDDAERADFLAHYAPPLIADHAGTQVFQALQFIRDQAWFFPHFKRDPAHNLGGAAMPAELLHVLTVELLKAAPTYHLAYRAVFRHRLEERLPRVRVPAMLMADDTDPTRESVRRAAALLPGSKLAVGGEGWSAEGVARKAARIAEFFDA